MKRLKTIFRLACLCLLWLPLFLANNNVIYLDASLGIDDVTCGNMTSPCKSLDTTWKRYMWSSNISGEVSFYLKPGNYIAHGAHNPVLSSKCSGTFVTSIGIIMDVDRRMNTDEEQLAHLYNSFDFTDCLVLFSGIQFHRPSIKTTDSNISFAKCIIQNTDQTFVFLRSAVIFSDTIFHNVTSSSDQILILRSKNLTFIDCTFRHNTWTSQTNHFLDGDVIHSVTFENVEFSDNSGLQSRAFDLEFFSLKNVAIITIKNMTISRNVDFILLFENLQTTIGDHWFVDDNRNTTISFQNCGNSNISNIDLHRNYRTKNRVAVLEFNGGDVLLKKLNIVCVHFKHRDQFGSPVVARAGTSLHCHNCTKSYCQRLCGTGYQNVMEVLCEECPKGSSAHDWESTCKQCHHGYHSPTTGASDCVPCTEGTYCNHIGCSECMKCTNDFFTSQAGSSECTQMNLFFKIMLGVVICLVMGPIAILVIKKKKSKAVEKVVKPDGGERRTAGKTNNNGNYEQLDEQNPTVNT